MDKHPDKETNSAIRYTLDSVNKSVHTFYGRKLSKKEK
jgi:hypothetical protein